MFFNDVKQDEDTEKQMVNILCLRYNQSKFILLSDPVNVGAVGRFKLPQ